MNPDWDRYFLDISEVVSKKSHCLSRQLGCVVVRDRQILSTGYNGPPHGMRHCEYRNDKGFYCTEKSDKCPRQRMGFRSGEGLEYCPASHAEANAIVQAAKSGVNLNGATMYGNFSQVPCRECSKLIVNSGITKVVLDGGDTPYPQSGILGVEILKECGIQISYEERG
jgi:dCMP deaminase